MSKRLDLITIGRSSVDLYGAQIGGLLEDMASFNKYVGGSPPISQPERHWLGLRSALITRVGDEHMGRFLLRELEREGVDTRGIVTDPERLTALVILGIRDQQHFPLIFYRENCADMALCEDDIDPDFIAEARCVLATGTHLSHPRTEAAVLKALRLARETAAARRLILIIAPTYGGFPATATAKTALLKARPSPPKLQSTLHLFDLIVGTEEEFHIAGGSTDTLEALKCRRAGSRKQHWCASADRWARVVFEGDIPDDLDKAAERSGFPIEVFNVLGAGDGFMSGLLRGWLISEDWPTSLKFANACGAFAVSRHGCTPAYPSREELQFFLQRGICNKALRKDAETGTGTLVQLPTVQWHMAAYARVCLLIIAVSSLRKWRRKPVPRRTKIGEFEAALALMRPLKVAGGAQRLWYFVRRAARPRRPLPGGGVRPLDRTPLPNGRRSPVEA
ncbi:5-dehydro-2-deoxygluconokinase [Brucella abortus]|nr:5-dehydro-2-deoxygluconokinase [Brucella abortus]